MADPTSNRTLDTGIVAVPGTGREDDTRPQATCLAARYLFLGLVGSGGMGSVYRARDLWLEETIAVKTLSSGGLHALGREVRLARRITHPNVVRVFDLGVDGETRFITMELVDAGSLQGAATRPFAPASVVEIGRQICAGLGAAHAAGIGSRARVRGFARLGAGHGGRRRAPPRRPAPRGGAPAADGSTRARALPPRPPRAGEAVLVTYRWMAGRLAYLLREPSWEAALAEVPPDPALQNFFWLNRLRIALYAKDGRLRDAELVAYEAGTFDLKQGLDVFVALARGVTVARAALAVADELARCDPRLRRRRALAAVLKAELAAAAGEWDSASEAYRRAAREGSIDAIWVERCPLALEIRRRCDVAGAAATILARAAELRSVLGSTL